VRKPITSHGFHNHLDFSHLEQHYSCKLKISNQKLLGACQDGQWAKNDRIGTLYHQDFSAQFPRITLYMGYKIMIIHFYAKMKFPKAVHRANDFGHQE